MKKPGTEGAGAINDAVEREKTAFLTDTNLGGPRSELMTPYNEPHTDVNTGILGAGPNEAAIATKTLVRTLVGGKVGSLVWSKIACGIVAHYWSEAQSQLLISPLSFRRRRPV